MKVLKFNVMHDYFAIFHCHLAYLVLMHLISRNNGVNTVYFFEFSQFLMNVDFFANSDVF